MDLTVIWFFFLLQYIDVNFAPHISIAYSLMPHTLCKGPVHVPLKSRISIKCHLKYTKLVYLLLHLFNHKDILHNPRYHRYLGMCTISLRLDRTASTIAKTIFVIEFRIRLRYIFICIYIYMNFIWDFCICHQVQMNRVRFCGCKSSTPWLFFHQFTLWSYLK